jgi:hypothetical protein
MKIFKKSIILLLVPLFAFSATHKFYVSVTNVVYSKKDDALQITSRIFIDDIEAVFNERYDIEYKLADEKEVDESLAYLQKYLRTKLEVSVNGQVRPHQYIGKKIDNDVVIVFLEVPEIDLSNTKTIEVSNKILMDLFDEQQNIVHLKINDLKKSYVLTKENAKGVLNL